MIKQHISIGVNIVIFTIIDDKAHILLIKRKSQPFVDKYAFPGGLINDLETLNEAAVRLLNMETGIDNVNLEILDVYDELDRDPNGRLISVAFIGFVDFNRINHLKAKSDALISQWVAINEVKELAFDHNKIYTDSLKFLTNLDKNF